MRGMFAQVSGRTYRALGKLVRDLVLRRVRRVPVTRVLLEGAGHYSLEQPGLAQFTEAILAFVRDQLGIRLNLPRR